MTARVAIYAVPGARRTDAAGLLLRERAESWLGRCVDGAAPASGLPDGWSREAVDDITVDARRYGFHGTLKAPFRLADGATLEQLEQDVAQFATTRGAAPIPKLTLGRIGSFFALVPGVEARELQSLADAVITTFDSYRAPASEAEIARRVPDSLSTRQRELLATWGYPYVLDEFRFHLTLTDRIPPERQTDVQQSLTTWFADCIGETIAVDALALFTESDPGAPFRLHSVHPFQPSPDPSRPSERHDHEGSR